MVVGKWDIPEVIDDSAEKTSTQVVRQERLESLLFDDSSHSQTGDCVVQQSSRVMGGKQTLIPLLLLVVLFFAVYYLYVSYISVARLPATQMNHYVSPMIPIPARPQNDLPAVRANKSHKTPPVGAEINSFANSPGANSVVPLFTVAVGPFINDIDLQEAIGLLEDLGLQPQKVSGRGLVTMIRLLEGVYPEDEARIHLAELKEIDESAFLLPLGDKLAVYAGSFHRESWAKEMQNDLAAHMVNVALVESEITMNGTLLTVLQADQQTANEMAAHISSLGLHTQLLTQK